MKKFIRMCIWLIIHIIAFVLVAWAFLGLTPTETYQKFIDRMTSIRNGTLSFTADLKKTGSNLGKTVTRHYNDSENVRQGHDPFENFNSTIDQRIRNNEF